MYTHVHVCMYECVYIYRQCTPPKRISQSARDIWWKVAELHSIYVAGSHYRCHSALRPGRVRTGFGLAQVVE